jgi:hypothetical protein
MVFCRRPITRSSSRKRLAIDYWPLLLAIDCLFVALDGMRCPVKLRTVKPSGHAAIEVTAATSNQFLCAIYRNLLPTAKRC